MIHFLGTGAADWDSTKKETSMEYRRFSSVCIHENLLIDAGPCIFEFAETFGYPQLFQKIEFVLVTHSHSDHFSPKNISRLCAELAPKPIVFCGDKSIEKLLPTCSNLQFLALELEKPTILGEYSVMALPANHSIEENPEETPLHYIIETAEKSIFYGCDGAWLLKSTRLALNGHQFDLMVLDGTVGDCKGDYRIFEHNNLTMVEEMAASFRKCGLLKDDGKIIISHMARTLHTDHATLQKRLEAISILPAYDNWKIEI